MASSITSSFDQIKNVKDPASSAGRRRINMLNVLGFAVRGLAYGTLLFLISVACR